MKTDEFIIVYVTTSKRAEAREIGEALVESRLASCVQITSPIESIYRWEGEVCNEEEYLLIAKTRMSLFGRVAEYIKDNHSYEVPQIVAVPIIEGTKDYLSWIRDNTKGY